LFIPFVLADGAELFCAEPLPGTRSLHSINEAKKNTLRYLMGEEQITHLGLDYYYDV
jgi:hypothetical protein